MINPNHDLSLTRQAELLQLSRASIYYEPVGISQADLKLMRRIDELHLEWPFLGSRMLRNMLRLAPDSVYFDSQPLAAAA
jgi:putative transposase